MRKTTGIWLVTAASLVVLGLLIFAAVMTANHWDFSKLSTVAYETNTYQIGEEFDNIVMETDTADIRFVPSDDGRCKVVCHEQEKVKHTVSVGDGTLAIRAVDERKWYEYIGITLGNPTITVYLPETEYGAISIKESTGDVELPDVFWFESMDISTGTGSVKAFASASGTVKISTSTGSIRVENISAGALDLSVSTGKVLVSSLICAGDLQIRVSTGETKLSDIICAGVITGGSTGDLSMKNVIAAERLVVQRSTGDVMLEKCDAAELVIKTDTGDVTGTLCSGKVFVTETKTGTVSVPKSITGGTCEITTSTGDIKIALQTP